MRDARGTRTILAVLVSVVTLCVVLGLAGLVEPHGGARVDEPAPKGQVVSATHDAGDANRPPSTRAEATLEVGRGEREDADNVPPVSADDDEQDAADADWDEEPQLVQEDEAALGHVFTLPEEGVLYEPGVALVHVDEGASAQTVADALASRGYGAATSEVVDGMLRVELDDATLLEEAINSLVEDDVVASAQPNYRYVIAQDEELPQVTEDNGGEGTAEEDDAVQDELATMEGNETSVDESQQETETESNETLVEDAQHTVPLEDANATVAVEDDEMGIAGNDTVAPALATAAAATNDTYADKLWGLDLLQAADAWKLVKANRSVTVAVIDSGVDTTHEDLKANVVGAYNVSTGTSNVMPSFGSAAKHGTHVAGIIAAVANNELGVCGVTYNAQLMPVKVTDASGYADTQDIAKAFDYVIRHASAYNVRVINLSMCMEGNMHVDDDLLARIDQAYQKGIVTVCAAGNASSSSTGEVPYDCYPSDYDHVVSAINLKQLGTTVVRNEESNYNAAGTYGKNISAPGTSIMSTVPMSEGKYGRLSGTSMAAPYVAGVVALEFAANASLSAQGAIDTLYATTVDLGSSGWDRTYGYGEANAYGAVYGALHGVSAAQLRLVEQQRAREAAAKDAKALASLQYRTYVQDLSWGSWQSKGAVSGTKKSGRRVEALEFQLRGSPYSGGIQYRARLESGGWQAWEANGDTSGAAGQGKRVEAIKVRLTGEMATRYDVWYRVYVAKLGWSGWAKNGSSAGTIGYGYRVEALQAQLVAKGSAAPGKTANALRFTVKYRTRLQGSSWQAWRKNGKLSGKKGATGGISAVRLKLAGAPYSGAITYRVRMKGTGWQGWRKNGALAGSKMTKKRLGAIRIKLTGTLAQHYSVYYRVYAKGYGWLGWAKNGAPAGSASYAHLIQGLQVRIVERGAKAPGSTAGAYRSAK